MADLANNSVSKEKAPKKSFFKGVKAEFKKISWPAREQMLKQSVAVICISLVLGMIITLLDKVLQVGVSFLTM